MRSSMPSNSSSVHFFPWIKQNCVPAERRSGFTSSLSLASISANNEIIKKILAVILAGGHILLEDIPGVGKTTLALAMTKSLGLSFGRVQFTPDVVPSDITGFTVYDRENSNFKYIPGAVMCNMFLGDEINRTSSKTQSALLEVMQEGKVTVDGVSHEVPKPFTVIATQNPVGTAGTQMLPEAQLDRFMMKLSMGYPSFDEQVKILSDREQKDPLDEIVSVIEPYKLDEMIREVKTVYTDEKIYRYITSLVEATRENEFIKLGVSPRGAIALATVSRAWAYIEGRDYVVPEDIDTLFVDVCAHRVILEPKGKISGKSTIKILKEILNETKAPKTEGFYR